jgi:NADPH-ferrihemoprotein reductase
VHPSSVHVCGVVVEYRTPTGRTNKGVATTWLKEKVPREGDDLPRIPVYVRRSQFRLPNRAQTPVIMIGPGTGLAPFRGFIQVP